jgi:hypothetical protein
MGEWMYRSMFSWPQHYLEVRGQLHVPAALPRGKSPRYPLDRRLGGPQSQSRRRGKEKILDFTGTRTPTPQSSNPIDRQPTFRVNISLPSSRSKNKASSCPLLSRLYLARLILRPWRLRRYVPPKCRLTFNGLHGVISQKLALFESVSVLTRSTPKSLNKKRCYLQLLLYFKLLLYSLRTKASVKAAHFCRSENSPLSTHSYGQPKWDECRSIREVCSTYSAGEPTCPHYTLYEHWYNLFVMTDKILTNSVAFVFTQGNN